MLHVNSIYVTNTLGCWMIVLNIIVCCQDRYKPCVNLINCIMYSRSINDHIHVLTCTCTCTTSEIKVEPSKNANNLLLLKEGKVTFKP